MLELDNKIDKLKNVIKIFIKILLQQFVIAINRRMRGLR